jgi:hypothetical protein
MSFLKLFISTDQKPTCQNKRQAMKIASAFLANSMLNDLKTIKTRKTVKP